MHTILRLDVAGQPRGWITVHEAISAYAKGDVIYGIGETLPPYFGGIQRLTGQRSRIDLQPIVAIQGRIIQGFSPPLCNRTLFRRDNHRCLYCGQQYSRADLTRDHVLPTSRGGTNRWGNVVAACKRCNWQKDDRTPEEARMPLLAVPFKPNPFEWHFLAKDRILTDQMDYLSQRFRGLRAWAS
jgi:5-methylcytosine-specific restriction endonuclease McrA